MRFTTKDELIEQAIFDGACDKGIEFAKSCKDLQEIFDTIDYNMSWWCLRKGYDQFADRFNWKKLDGWSWASLLSIQPKFSDRCDWEKLDAADWCCLLRHQPQLDSNFAKKAAFVHLIK